MTTTQHTPGPWVREEEDETILILSVDEAYPIAVIETPVQEDYANANLIAAAPDLLKALKSVMEWTEFHDVWFQRSLEEEIEAAIAKAEGAAHADNQ